MGDPRPEAVQRRDKLRPRTLGMGGALLAMVVAVVIFIGIVLWYTVNPAEIEPARLSDLEVVHRLATACHERYPQGALAAEAHLAEALPRLERARFAPADPDLQGVEVLLCKALAVEPGCPEALLGWAELAALRGLRGEDDSIELQRAAALLEALRRFAPDTRDLTVVERELARALRSPGGEPPGGE
ncbi:MAG: hypothetical protein ABIO70_17915 [Pseudomonadota bacterium]